MPAFDKKEAVCFCLLDGRDRAILPFDLQRLDPACRRQAKNLAEKGAAHDSVIQEVGDKDSGAYAHGHADPDMEERKDWDTDRQLGPSRAARGVRIDSSRFKVLLRCR